MSFCPNCGTKLEEGAKFCPGCGTPVAASTPVQPTPVQPTPVQPTPVQSANDDPFAAYVLAQQAKKSSFDIKEYLFEIIASVLALLIWIFSLVGTNSVDLYWYKLKFSIGSISRLINAVSYFYDGGFGMFLLKAFTFLIGLVLFLLSAAVIGLNVMGIVKRNKLKLADLACIICGGANIVVIILVFLIGSIALGFGYIGISWAGILAILLSIGLIVITIVKKNIKL